MTSLEQSEPTVDVFALAYECQRKDEEAYLANQRRIHSNQQFEELGIPNYTPSDYTHDQNAIIEHRLAVMRGETPNIIKELIHSLED